jgi:hypothetical protein
MCLIETDHFKGLGRVTFIYKVCIHVVNAIVNVYALCIRIIGACDVR